MFDFQLLNGCSETELNKLRLVRDPAAYYFIANGNNNKTTISDRSDYKAVCTAMSILGFSPNEVQTIWNIVAGILHLVGRIDIIMVIKLLSSNTSYIFFFSENYSQFRYYFLVIFQGNVTFRLDDDKLIIENNSALSDTANLFSISSKDLSTALSQRVIAAGGEVMQKTHTLIEAEYGRDALAKVCSMRMWIHFFLYRIFHSLY